MPGLPTLVLVHGGTFTSLMWSDVRAHLRAPSIAVDLPGRRYRPADLGRVGREDWVRSVVADLDAVGLDSAVLVGHSSAGYVIPGVAATRPAVVRGLVFVAATVPAEGMRPVDFLRPDLHRLAVDTRDVVVEQATGRTLGGLVDGEPPVDTDLEIVENGPRLGLEAPGPLFEPFSWAGFPSQLPRLFVRCSADRVITPEMVETMVANMGGAEIVDVEAGHSVARTAPAELASVLDRFARRLADTGS